MNVPKNPIRRWLPHSAVRRQNTRYMMMPMVMAITPSFFCDSLPLLRGVRGYALEVAVPFGAASLAGVPAEGTGGVFADDRAANLSFCAFMNSR